MLDTGRVEPLPALAAGSVVRTFSTLSLRRRRASSPGKGAKSRAIAAPTIAPSSRPSASVPTIAPSEWPRSEEHTSELQSHSDLVCRLLLEKKKQQTI